MGVRHYYYGNYVIYNKKKSESRCGCSSLIFVTAIIRNFNFSIFNFSISPRTYPESVTRDFCTTNGVISERPVSAIFVTAVFDFSFFSVLQFRSGGAR